MNSEHIARLFAFFSGFVFAGMLWFGISFYLVCPSRGQMSGKAADEKKRAERLESMYGNPKA